MTRATPKPATKARDRRVAKHPPRIDGRKALAAIEPFTVDLLVNADVWMPAFHAARVLFPDAEAASVEHYEAVSDVCKAKTERATQARRDRLEATEWAVWHRRLQAAYVLGISVGQTPKGGA
jgi:hypothetical protein